MVKVPGGQPASSAPSPPVSSLARSQEDGGPRGIGPEVSFTCPQCHGHLSGIPGQGAVICPECLESVPVPPLREPASNSREPASNSREPSSSDSSTPPPPPPPPPPGTTDFDWEPPLVPDQESPKPLAVETTTERTIEEFGLKCTVCGTRMIVTRDQVGKVKVCPDCHTSHTVPHPTSTMTRKQAVSPDAEQGEDDEYQMAPPVERPAGFGLDTATLEEIGRAARDEATGELVSQELRDTELALRCKACNRRMYASMADLGATRKCPGCGHANRIELPRAPQAKSPQAGASEAGAGGARQSRRVASAGSAADTETDVPKRPRTEADDALDRARAEARQRRGEEAKLDGVPWWRWVQDFLVDLPTLARILPLSLGMAVCLTLANWAAAWWVEGIGAIFALLFGILTFLVGACVATAMAVFGQVVIGDTANGNQRISNWPDGMFMDWWMDSLLMLNALFLSSLPGVLLGQLLRLMGAPVWLMVLSALFSIWLLFPPVVLSMLEANSPIMPASLPIWSSLVSAPTRWVRFYAISGGLALLLFLTLLLLLPCWMLLNLLGSLLITAIVMVYCRVLGHFAWTCEDVFLAAEQHRDERRDKSDKARL
jgi:DNA-directed RNA polymerase subunit M/transcription elongation factor TFIIS